VEIILCENFLGKLIFGKIYKIKKFFFKNIRIFISSIGKIFFFSFFSFFSKFFFCDSVFKICQKKKGEKTLFVFSNHFYFKKGKIFSRELGKIITSLIRQKSGILINIKLNFKF